MDDPIVGIDEAGRGAWLGPLVVGAFAVPAARLEDVAAAGACDSKRLAPRAREAVYGRLRRIGTCRSVVVPPATIDRYVARGRLNDLEAEAFAQLVRDLRPRIAYVDACDANAARFGRTVAGLAGPGPTVVARHKADRDLPIVGAASIVAKVRRDRAVARLARRLDAELGSGYPSDPRTVAFVRERLANRPERPAWLRSSWATTQRVIPARPARTLDGYPG